MVMKGLTPMDANGWFDVIEFPDGVVGIREPGHVVDVWSFLIRGSELALLFDTGNGFADIRAVVEGLTSAPVLVVNSHSHWDHIGDNWRFERVWVHEAEAEPVLAGVPNSRFRHWLAPEYFSRPLEPPIDPETYAIRPSAVERTLRGGETIDLGDRTFAVIHTPGHSPGGITLFEERTGLALVGDAIYAGALYAQLDDSDPTVYRATLARLAELAPSMGAVYPSHYEAPVPARLAIDIHDAMEALWEGSAPGVTADGVESFAFDGFSFLFKAGWRG
jgi:glyoxylase-like metal-dependent hydrolase (beta-lactamase superfamily II)